MGLDATPPAGPSALDATLLHPHPHPLSPAALARALRDVSAELYDGHAGRRALADERRDARSRLAREDK